MEVPLSDTDALSGMTPQPHCVQRANSHRGKGWGRLPYRSLLWELKWLNSYFGRPGNFHIGIQYIIIWVVKMLFSGAH